MTPKTLSERIKMIKNRVDVDDYDLADAILGTAQVFFVYENEETRKALTGPRVLADITRSALHVGVDYSTAFAMGLISYLAFHYARGDGAVAAYLGRYVQ